MYLEKTNQNPLAIIFKCFQAELLIKGKSTVVELDINFDNFYQANYILAPINIKSHWMLFVMKTKEGHGRHAFIMDPLENNDDKEMYEEMLNKTYELHILLERAYGHSITWVEYSNTTRKPPQYQTNKHDCGPMICGYAIKVSQKQGCHRINFMKIRKEVQESRIQSTEIPQQATNAIKDINPKNLLSNKEELEKRQFDEEVEWNLPGFVSLTPPG